MRKLSLRNGDTTKQFIRARPPTRTQILLPLPADTFPQHSGRHTSFPDQTGKFGMKAFKHIHPTRAQGPVRSQLQQLPKLRRCSEASLPVPTIPITSLGPVGALQGTEETLGSISSQAGDRSSSKCWHSAPSVLYPCCIPAAIGTLLLLP